MLASVWRSAAGFKESRISRVAQMADSGALPGCGGGARTAGVFFAFDFPFFFSSDSDSSSASSSDSSFSVLAGVFVSA